MPKTKRGLNYKNNILKRIQPHDLHKYPITYQKEYINKFTKMYKNINIPIDDQNNTILHLITKNGTLEMMQHICSYTANLSNKNNQNENILFCCLHDLEKIKFILQKNPKIINSTIIHYNDNIFVEDYITSQENNFDINYIWDLWDLFVNLDEFDVIIHKNSMDIYFIFDVINYAYKCYDKYKINKIKECVNICKILLFKMKKENLDLNCCIGEFDMSILQHIAMIESNELLEYYLEINPNVDINYKDSYDETTLYSFVVHNANFKWCDRINFVMTLLKAGAYANCETSRGGHILQSAYDNDIANLLIEHDADSKYKSKCTKCPIYSAFTFNFEDKDYYENEDENLSE